MREEDYLLKKAYIEDEIDLKELFQVIWNKKIFIIVFTLFITIVSGFYIYSKRPIYEVKSYIEIGFIDKERIEQPKILEQKLKVIFSVEDFNEELNSLEKGSVTSIKQMKSVDNFLEIRTEAFSNEKALEKNKKVLEYVQSLYNPKIEQYKVILNNNILDTQRDINYIKDVEIKNVIAQINILKEQEIKNIDRQIDVLKTQEIKKIDNEIKVLKEQTIPLLKTEMDFLSKTKIKSLQDKVLFYSKSLEKYNLELNNLMKKIDLNSDASSMIASIQILNYQNLITNTQNQIKDLEIQIESILKDDIPKLKNKIDNINNIQVYNLETEKRNIFNINIKDLEIKKQNVSNETIRKLQSKIDIELKTKITQLNEKIETLNFKKSEQNLSNMKLVGDYIISDNPIKPKKSLVIMVSFVTSFILSIFIVFVLDFINNTKINSQKEE
jgi:hypothetical protein